MDAIPTAVSMTTYAGESEDFGNLGWVASSKPTSGPRRREFFLARNFRIARYPGTIPITADD
jgi:hypothetical protein